MATISVYDNDTGLTKQITVDIGQATVAGSGTGAASFYVTVSTNAKDPSGGAIPTLIITDFYDNLTTEIKAAVVTLFRHILGEYMSSSSSSDVTISSSSLTGDGLTSESSASSQSTRVANESESSGSSESPSSVSSSSSLTNTPSSASSLSSVGESSETSQSGI